MLLKVSTLSRALQQSLRGTQRCVAGRYGVAQWPVVKNVGRGQLLSWGDCFARVFARAAR